MQTIDLIWFVFFILIGASVGSFLNVVIYRLPAEKSLVHPGSHCPLCGHKLRWWENIPILAWFYLGARCTNCHARISSQYVIIESITAAIFAAFYWLYYLHYPHFGGYYAQIIFNQGVLETWPLFVAHMILISALIAATLIDFRYFIIPVEIPWFASAAALLLPIFAWRFPNLGLQHYAPGGLGESATTLVPTCADNVIGPAIGAVLGVGLAKLLVEVGLIPRSFDMYFEEVASESNESGPSPASGDAVATTEVQTAAAGTTETAAPDATANTTAPPDAVQNPEPSPAVAIAAAPAEAAPSISVPTATSTESQGDQSAEAVATPPPEQAELVVHRTSPVDQPLLEPDPFSDQPWPTHPHPRREVMKEVIFLIFPLIGWFLGMYLWQTFVLHGSTPRFLSSDSGTRIEYFIVHGWQFLVGPDAPYHGPMAPSVRTLGGVCLGYLVGGGMIWLTRILGTLGFGKEAVGLGDVYLMGAIGAILGAQMSVYIYFLAPFLGLTFACITFIASRFAKGWPRVLPYGPFLALATLILLVRLRGP